MEINKSDFKYLKGYEKDMRAAHEKDFIGRLEPERIQKYYESERLISQIEASELGSDAQKVKRITLNKFFPATQTLLAVLYPRNPSFICTSKRGKQEDFSAKIAMGAMNYYFDELNSLEENQDAIINAWFFGYGIIKQGWRQTFAYVDKNEGSFLEDVVRKAQKVFTGEVNVEQEEVVLEDGPFLESVSPLDLELDHKRPFGKGRFICQKIPRTLDDIINSSLYKGYISSDFINNFRTKDDDRLVELIVREMWSVDNRGLYYVTYFVDEWNEPLAHKKMGYLSEKFPYKLLRLQKQASKYSMDKVCTYPMSHFKIAMKDQREIDYILTLWLRNIDKFRSQTYVNKQKVKNSTEALEANEIGGIIYGEGPAAAGDIVSIGSTPLKQEMVGLLDMLIMNMQEILTVTGARMGQTDMPTATQEQITESGNQVRTAGMQSAIRGFVIAQGKKLLQDLKQFATAPTLFKITGLDLRDPNTGQLITETWREFGTSENPQALKDAIQGEFDIEIDVHEEKPKNPEGVRAELTAIFNFLRDPMVLQALAQDNKRIRFAELIEDVLENSEVVNNPMQYIEDIPPEVQQQQAERAQTMQMMGGQQ